MYRFSLAALVLASFFTFFLFGRSASAHDPLDVRGFGEVGAGVRTIDMRGSTLKTAGSSRSSDSTPTFMTVDGGRIGTTFAGTLTLGGGLTIGPVVGGVEIGLGIGGGAGAPVQRAGDIEVRPSGMVAAATASTYLGLMYERKTMRYRLDGVLGSELVGYMMERPGHPDTDVSAVNAVRWTVGPRARIDWRLEDGGSIGFSLSADTRVGGNVMVGVVLTTL